MKRAGRASEKVSVCARRVGCKIGGGLVTLRRGGERKAGERGGEKRSTDDDLGAQVAAGMMRRSLPSLGGFRSGSVAGGQADDGVDGLQQGEGGEGAREGLDRGGDQVREEEGGEREQEEGVDEGVGAGEGGGEEGDGRGSGRHCCGDGSWGVEFGGGICGSDGWAGGLDWFGAVGGT